jgi:hypothetical protein
MVDRAHESIKMKVRSAGFEAESSDEDGRYLKYKNPDACGKALGTNFSLDFWYYFFQLCKT